MQASPPATAHCMRGASVNRSLQIMSINYATVTIIPLKEIASILHFLKIYFSRIIFFYVKNVIKEDDLFFVSIENKTKSSRLNLHQRRFK